MEELKRQWLPRMVVGGIAGVVVLYFIGGWLNGLGGQSLPLGNVTAFSAISPHLVELVRWEPLAAAVQMVLYFALGAGAGVATLPFADSGRELVVRSAIHFCCTAGVFSLLVWLCRWSWGRWLTWLAELGILAMIYVLIWLGRWVGWYTEAAAIREKLGLAPGPSLFHWKETLPYLGFAGLFCLAAPVIVWACDDHRIPLLSILYAVVILPLAGFTSGLSLGRRHGFCPLYPVACGAVAGVFVAAAWLCSYSLGGSRILAAAFSALAGNLAGTALLRRKRQKADLCGREGS